ncbi:MAG: cysteine methyltransferase [Aeromicrobium sp.]|nr:cysteine methyltransferase [Aeromicrobium sp.]
MNVRHAIITTSLGDLTAVAEDDAVAGIYFPHHWHPPVAGSIGELVDEADDPVIAGIHRQLDEFLAGERAAFDLPIATHGNAFEESVWALLNEIPYGETTTYGELAAQLGDPSLARKVGQAVGHNPISVIVPCHRVLGKDGKLTGYAGGLTRKQTLLDLEEPAGVTAGKLF